MLTLEHINDYLKKNKMSKSDLARKIAAQDKGIAASSIMSSLSPSGFKNISEKHLQRLTSAIKHTETDDLEDLVFLVLKSIMDSPHMSNDQKIRAMNSYLGK